MQSLVESADGVVRDAAGEVWGVRVPTTVLAGELGGEAPAGRRIMRAGFLPLEDDGTCPDPRTWGPVGWGAMEAGVRRAVGAMTGRLLIQPAWTDVISDAPSCVRFLDLRAAWGGEDRLGLLLDPGAMLAPTMLANAADHVQRILEIVGGRAGVDAVVVSAAVEPAVYRELLPATTPLLFAAGGGSAGTPYSAG